MGVGVAVDVVKSTNVVVYIDDSVYDETSDERVYGQWKEEECCNCWEIPIGKVVCALRYEFDVEAEGRQCGDYEKGMGVKKLVLEISLKCFFLGGKDLAST